MTKGIIVKLDTKYQDPDRAWIMVELFRWQYGKLPGSDDMRKVDLVEATRKMALAIDDGKVAPFDAAMVIAWLGKNCKEVLP